MRETLREYQRDHAHQGFREKQLCKQLPDTRFLLRAHIVTDDRNAAGCHSHDNGNHDLEEFHHNPDNRHGNLRVLLLPKHRVKHAVFAKHIVDGRHRCHQTDLRKKTRYAQRQHTSADLLAQRVIAFLRLDVFHMQQIPYRKRRGGHLSDYCRYSRTHHTPPERKDKDGIKDDIDDCACQRRNHRESWISIRADDRIHRLSEHIKRNSQCDVKEILLCMAERFFVHCAAKHRDDTIGKNQIQRGQHKTADYNQQHRVADTALRLFDLVPAECHADKSAAAIPDHNGNRQGYDRQRKDNRICRVSVRAEIARIGDKDLIDNIIQCPD